MLVLFCTSRPESEPLTKENLVGRLLSRSAASLRDSRLGACVLTGLS